ncbi:MFS transporter [Olivibacter ginsenosidimutans]|uniref:MFS transporter n=1 Tax=Olivibacter ginsenosidimutans TaxID=1176537 RepID=A0ABP9C7Q0_9SPHI
MQKKSRIISFIVGGTLLMEMLDGTAISTALPKMAHDFQTNVVHLSAGITSYTIMLAVFIPISGWVADTFGAKKIFSTAIIAFILSSIACGLCRNLPLFVLARICQGTAGALMVPVGRLIVLKNTEKKDLVDAIGYIAWAGLMGPILGPVLGGFFTTYLSWHWIFFINIPFGLLALWLTHQYIPAMNAENKRPLDKIGFIISGLGLSGIMVGTEMIGNSNGEYTKPGLVLLLSFALMGISVWHSKKTAYPLIDYTTLKIKTFAVTVYSGTITRMVINVAPFILPLMLQLGFGLNPFHAGLLYMANMLGSMSMKPPAIWITRRFNFRTVLIGNGLILTAITFTISFLSISTPLWLVGLVFFISGMTRSLQFTSLNTLAYADIPAEGLSNANTLYNTAQQMALGMGIALGAVTLHLASTFHQTIGNYQMTDFRLALRMISLLSFLSLLEYFKIKPTDGSNLRGITITPVAQREALASQNETTKTAI